MSVPVEADRAEAWLADLASGERWYLPFEGREYAKALLARLRVETARAAEWQNKAATYKGQRVAAFMAGSAMDGELEERAVAAEARVVELERAAKEAKMFVNDALFCVSHDRPSAALHRLGKAAAVLAVVGDTPQGKAGLGGDETSPAAEVSGT